MRSVHAFALNFPIIFNYCIFDLVKLSGRGSDTLTMCNCSNESTETRVGLQHQSPGLNSELSGLWFYNR